MSKERPDLPQELPNKKEQKEVQPVPIERPANPERPEVTPGKETITPIEPGRR